MVTLNFTLLIELMLFLIFLWGTAQFILRPVLRNIDAREESIEKDRTQAATDTEETKQIETRYSEEWAEIRGTANEAYRAARSETMKGHVGAIADAHQWADKAVAEAREKAMQSAADQRDAIKASVSEVADLIAERLRSGGSS